MTGIAWTRPAFRQLERLPEAVAFTIIKRVDLLASFPEMGVRLETKHTALVNCRQLIVSGNYRVVYEVEEAAAGRIYILAVQHARRKLPPERELRRRLADEKIDDGES